MQDSGSGQGSQGRGPEDGRARFDRRRFLRGAAVGAGGLAGLSLAATDGTASAAEGRRSRGGSSAVRLARLGSGVEVPTARWLLEENAKLGSQGWWLAGQSTIEGYASQVSARQGDDVVLFVNTQDPSFHVEVYRMGFYQGLGGRLIETSDTVAAADQPTPQPTGDVSMVECSWDPSITLRVGRHWPPGNYLFKLVSRTGQQYVPFCVRDDASHATYVLQNSVTTWQAYNLWGEYSLYYGATPSGGSDYDNRSRVVSFDRPYPSTWAQGAADWMGNEFPLLFEMERLGLDMTYWTDVDLHARPELLANHRALFSLGHDEYWSRPMRGAAALALDRGTNLAFLGANACYRQIRMEDNATGPHRRQICYKDASEDPLNGVDDALVTVNWESPPLDEPESTLIGSMYQSVGADCDLVITDSSHWIFDGCGLSDGQSLPGVVEGEFDRYVPGLPGPTNVDVLAHSPITNQQSDNWSDITYYTQPKGGGVFAVGMASFVNKLGDSVLVPTGYLPAAIPGVTDVLLRSMHNIFAAFGAGPASTHRPSGSNWSSVYQGASADQASAQGTNAA